MIVGKPKQLFILKSILFIIIGFSPFLVYLCIAPNNSTDRYYNKVASSSQNSLIVGASRAANGLRSDVFNNSVLKFDGPLFNFAFDNLSSPFCESYLNSIKAKLNGKVKNGLFIVSVGPLSVSERRNRNENSELEKHPENFQYSNVILPENTVPNPEYLIRKYPKPFYNILWDRMFAQEKFISHNDGWIEQKLVQKSRNKSANGAIDLHETTKDLQSFKVHSEERIEYLIKTIRFLKEHGKVYLVRMPTNKYWATIETDYWPDFNERMTDISVKTEVPYFNLLESCFDCNYFDGHHLMGTEGEKISRLLLDSIVKTQQGQ